MYSKAAYALFRVSRTVKANEHKLRQHGQMSCDIA